jgi:hypothetical protein
MKTEDELNKERAELKEKYGKFNEVEIFLDEDDTEKTATIFLRKPDKKARKVTWELIGEKKSDKAIEFFLRNLYIGGDALDPILSNDYALASVDSAIVEMIDVHRATLKKN